MNRFETFTRKQPEAADLYQLAYDMVHTFNCGASQEITTDRIKLFRKYLSDLSLKNNKEFTTRKRGSNTFAVTRIS